jgi:hypothetical protein
MSVGDLAVPPWLTVIGCGAVGNPVTREAYTGGTGGTDVGDASC